MKDITYNNNNTYIFRDGDDYIVQLLNDNLFGASPTEWVENFIRHPLYAETKRRKGSKGNIEIFVVKKIMKQSELMIEETA
tara:strand:- start:259 stop:501 length:243 start_codon:yes stop_codon:yes gene_type:complete